MYLGIICGTIFFDMHSISSWWLKCCSLMASIDKSSGQDQRLVHSFTRTTFVNS